MSTSAPPEIRFCSHCATPMITRQVGDKPRRACPACGFIHFTDPKVGTGVLIVEQGKVLLVRRRVMPEKGKWSIPAGFVDRGEDPRQTAVREVAEETGLTVVIDQLLEVFHNPASSPPKPQGGASIFILYQGHQIGGTLAAGDDADAAAFFAADALPPLAFISTREAIRRWMGAVISDAATQHGVISDVANATSSNQ